MKKLEITERRARVAQEILLNKSTAEIGRILNVSKATISRDAKAIINEWKELYDTEAIREWRISELARLSMIEEAIQEKVKKGDLYAIREQINLMKYRADLLGLKMPVKVEHTGADGGPIKYQEVDLSEKTDQELDAALKEVENILGV